MNKLNINSTINRSFFINGTRQLQLIGKKLPEALPIQAYSRTAANTLLNNVHPNRRKLSRRLCRPPPFPAMYGLFLNTKRKGDLAERSKTVKLRQQGNFL